MAYTTTQLISGAYYAAGVVSREFQTVSGSQLADGLQWLNEILSDKRVQDAMVPYEDVYTFNSRVGVKTYFIPNLIQIDTLVFYLDQVRYAMTYTKRNQFFGAPRVENIQSLPFEWYWERKVGGGNLHIYFAPDQNYPMEIHGTFDLEPLILGENLDVSETIANLGSFSVFGSGALAQGELVVNEVDLFGIYPNVGSFINYINTGIIPGVQARLDVNDVILFSNIQPPANITVRTIGFPPNGTSSKGSVAAATSPTDPVFGLTAGYNNGTDGVGATLTNTANGALVIDGYAAAVNDRLLITNRGFNIGSSFENGSYIVTDAGSVGTPWIITRTTNYDQPVEIGIGNLFTVLNGTVNAGLTFVQTADISEVGISPIVFIYFNAITFSDFSTIQLSFSNVFTNGGYDLFYITYLRYALADRICAEFNYQTPLNVVKQLAHYEAWISKKSRILDLEMKKVSTLQKRGTFNWAFVNLGKGWMKPG